METKVFAFLMESPLWTSYKQSKKVCPDLQMGRYNGYVGFNAILPMTWSSIEDYDMSLDSKIQVHGGITFDSKFMEKSSIIPLTEIPENWYLYRVIGFDCAHCDDKEENCPFEFAKKEALSLKEQIENIIKNKQP